MVMVCKSWNGIEQSESRDEPRRDGTTMLGMAVSNLESEGGLFCMDTMACRVAAQEVCLTLGDIYLLVFAPMHASAAYKADRRRGQLLGSYLGGHLNGITVVNHTDAG